MIEAYHLPYKPRKEALLMDYKARKRNKISQANLVFTEKHDRKLERESRPKMKVFLKELSAIYVKAHGVIPERKQLRLWKEQYRKIYHIKSCYRDNHNMAKTNTNSIKKPVIKTKIKHKPDMDRVLCLYGLDDDSLRKEDTIRQYASMPHDGRKVLWEKDR